MLIDSGATPIGNSMRIIEHLEAYNIKTLDYLMLTHPHSDHCNILTKVLEKYTVKELFVPKILPSYNFPDAKTRKGHINTKVYYKFYEQVLLQVEKGAILNYNVDTFSIFGEDYSFDFYCYGEDYYHTISGKSSNDEVNSLSPIGFLEYKQIRYAFTGDANYITEEYFISNYVTEENKKQFDSTLLKVGHHGSKTSTTTEFLDIILPEVSIICVGYNVFGHPTKEVLGRLSSIGSVIYNTRDNGKIRVEQCAEKLNILPDRGKNYIIILSATYQSNNLISVTLYFIPANRKWAVC
ncbi:MAG: ComEC/Rec2 family competence protein [Christensenellales bacterium]|jgi:competence protein ComEC